MRIKLHNTKLNPLNFFGVREVKSPVLHFEYVTIPLKYNLEKTIIKWINKNCKGRFYVGKTVQLDKADKVSTQLKIGFENHKELSYFILACPHLKYD